MERINSQVRQIALAVAAAGAFAAGAAAGTTTTTVDFSNGAEGWTGPQGPGGSTVIEPNGGNPGEYMHTIFNNFGIEFTTDTNQAFIGDYTQYDDVTLSIDVDVNDISFFGSPAPRDLIVELRDYDNAPQGYPYVSVWYTLTTMPGATDLDWLTHSVTIADTNATDLPAGWGGYGAEDPDTFEPELPADRTFASVLEGVDELAFSTYVPGFFFGFTDFDIGVDNISITTTPIPAPGALALLGVAGLCSRRRRR